MLDQLSLAQFGKDILLVCGIDCRRALTFFVEFFDKGDVRSILLHNTSGQVTSDAEEITTERALVGVEVLWSANQQHENFLGNFFGGGSIAAHMEGKTIERSLISVVNGG